MAIALRGLTGEDEAAVAEEAARGTPVLALLALLISRTGSAPEPIGPGTLSVGEMQALALRLRAASGEPMLRAGFRCDRCGERLDLELDCRELLGTPRGAPGMLRIGSVTITCRAPTVAEVLEAGSAATPGEAARRLLGSCASAEDDEGRPVPLEALDEHETDKVAAHLLALDPLAEIALRCTCPACSAENAATLDPAAFLLTELLREEGRMCAEVLAIATRTGWNEAEILSMPRRRRRLYAAALGGG